MQNVKNILRAKIIIRGAVQGVGFRPFVFRLAKKMNLPGWVINSANGVFIEIEGEMKSLNHFIQKVENGSPPRSFIQSMETSFLEPVGFDKFEIRHSDDAGEKTAFILPDIATCPDCLHEIFDENNSRYLYPFTNCTNCGPRFSIIEMLPYDRPNTSMKHFKMCEKCQTEYENPLDRRFHAQPNACPECGPQMEFWDAYGNVIARKHDAILFAVEMLKSGKIIAVKGIGGFHLMVHAGNKSAISTLRERKHREEKPLALMSPTIGLIEEHCQISEIEKHLLISPEAPIVLLKSKKNTAISTKAIAPENPTLGVMLPYSPLHHILLREFGFPVVATSGNISDEPICTDENDALKRLGNIADFFLIHNRPIVRHVDDSIVRVMANREMILRRARGFAPLPIQIKNNQKTVLGVGAHLKNSVALSVGESVFISQHIGDLETQEATNAFKKVIHDFENLYDARPLFVVGDLHPDYISTQFAKEMKKEFRQIQHHFAHIVSCMAENELDGEVLGVSWDGTGFGADGTIWGGEFLTATRSDFQRFAHFRTFCLPGGEKAIKEPRRAAIGLLYELIGNDIFRGQQFHPINSFSENEIQILGEMLRKNINSPKTSSVGRFFDAVAALVNIRQTARFEGQAAMELEFAIGNFQTCEYYPFEIAGKNPCVVDWLTMIFAILEDLKNGIALAEISAKFHNTMVEIIVKIAKFAGRERVVFSGGCFQNKYLTERTILRLREEKFKPYWHQRIPPNDGGISLGQVVATIYKERNEKCV